MKGLDRKYVALAVSGPFGSDHCLSLLIVIANLLYVSPPGGLTQPAATLSNEEHHGGAPKEVTYDKPRFFSLEWFTNDAVGFFTAVLSEFTLVLAGVSVTQICYLIKADRLARESLIASHRAWIKRKKDGLRFGTALTFPPDGSANSSIAFTITNVGTAPAMHVDLHAWLLPVTTGVIPEPQARARFSALRSGPPTRGFTLFPRETYPNTANVTLLASVRLTPAELTAASGGNPNANLNLYVACCIDYTFASDIASHHQTTFILEAQKADGTPIALTAS